MTNSANRWQLKTRSLAIDSSPLVMGIVNVTPDSFSDGGRFAESQSAVDQAMRLVEQGADILDIGGESTRPYSQPVSSEEELNRVVPVIQQLTAKVDVPISIDTSKAVVAAAALEAGAEIINDVTGLEGDPEMISLALQTGAGVCAMHMQGTPQTMQDDPQYQDVVEEIFDYLQQRRLALLEAGIARDRICLDPGIGFGKTHQHNVQLLANCRRFLDLEQPILIGHSRKGFIGKLLGNKEIDRDTGTLAASIWIAQQGIQVIRVHEVAETVNALKVIRGILDQAGSRDY